MSFDLMISAAGALVGAFAGMQVVRLGKKLVIQNQDNNTTTVTTVEDTYKYTLFDQKTRVLNSTFDIFIYLDKFNDILRYEVEFDAMKKVVKALDDMYYFESLMHGSKAERFSSQVRFAEAARKAALNQLQAIIDFGDKVIRSTTRRESLEENFKEIEKASEQTVESMHGVMASTM
jgi:hypothetical protein